MKKFLSLTMVTAVLCMCLAGCSIKEAERKIDEIENQVEIQTDKIEDEIEKKTDKIEDEVEKKTERFDDDGAWEAVEEQYEAVEIMAFIEASEKSGYTIDEIKNLVSDIDKYYQEIKEGITSENEQIVKTMYKVACTLDRMDDKHTGLSEHPVVELGDEAKDLIENSYNTKSSDYKESKKEFERALEKVKSYNDEDWKAIDGKL